MRWFVATTLVLSGLAGHALADDDYDRCISDSDGTNAAWSECGGAWLEREDARLNEAWKRVFSGFAGQSKADLLAEQRAWIAFKEASCLFYASGDFGREGQVLSFPSCRAGVTAERTAAIEAYGEGR